MLVPLLTLKYVAYSALGLSLSSSGICCGNMGDGSNRLVGASGINGTSLSDLFCGFISSSLYMRTPPFKRSMCNNKEFMNLSNIEILLNAEN